MSTAFSIIVLIMITMILQYLYRRRNRHTRQQHLFCQAKRNHLTTTETTATSKNYYHPKKPAWVIDEIIRLKALLGKKSGCRYIANTFNRLHQPRASVGKTFVANTIKNNQYDIAMATRNIRNKPPKAINVNHTWAMDLSFYTTCDAKTTICLGVIDHGSRLLLQLNTLKHKGSLTLLGHLCLAIARFGKPAKLRTDNEAIFTSYTFTTFLRLAGIGHQRIPTASPWKNGRMERLFGTLKPLLRQLDIRNHASLRHALYEFKQFYNHVRPHQNLHGRTPAEVWNKIDVRRSPHKTQLIKTLGGLLVGYHIRR